MPTADRRALYLAVLTMMTWGASGSFVRLLAHDLRPATPFVPLAILGGRLAVAFFALLLFLVLSQPRQFRNEIIPSLRHGEVWVGGGLQFIYYLLAVFAFTYAPISEIALCASTAPLWVLLIRRIRGNATSPTEMVGAGVSLAGVAVIVLPHLLHPDFGAAMNPFPHRLWGNALSLVSAVVTAVYALFQRRYTQRGTPIEARALTLVTLALGVPLAWFLKPIPTAVLLQPSTAGLLAGLAVMSTVLPTLAFAVASRRLPPVTTATVALLLPVFATSYAAIALHEIPSWTLVPGGLLVMLGLVMILRRPAAGPA